MRQVLSTPATPPGRDERQTGCCEGRERREKGSGGCGAAGGGGGEAGCGGQ